MKTNLVTGILVAIFLGLFMFTGQAKAMAYTIVPNCDLSIGSVLTVPVQGVVASLPAPQGPTVQLTLILINDKCGDLTNVAVKVDKGDNCGDPIMIYTNLNNNQQKTVQVTLNYYYNGSFNATATIDPYNQIKERNENNNQRTYRVQVSGGNPMNVSINLNSTTYKAGDTVDALATVTHACGREKIDKALISFKSPPGGNGTSNQEMQIIQEIEKGYVYEYQYTLPTGNPSNKGTWTVNVTALDKIGNRKTALKTFQLVNSPPKWIYPMPNLWKETGQNSMCVFNFRNYIYDLDGDPINVYPDFLCNNESLNPIECYGIGDYLIQYLFPSPHWEEERPTEVWFREVGGNGYWSSTFKVKASPTQPGGYTACTGFYMGKDESQSSEKLTGQVIPVNARQPTATKSTQTQVSTETEKSRAETIKSVRARSSRSSG